MPGIGSFVLLLIATQGIFGNDRIALHLHQRLLRAIDGNAVQPSVELRVAPELMQGAVSPDERLLGNVLDQIRVAHHAPDQALDAALVFDYHQLIGSLLARDRAFHQLEIAVLGGGGLRDGHGYSGWTPHGYDGPGAMASALPVPGLAREYTARCRSSQRSGWLDRSSHSQMRRRSIGRTHSHNWVCMSKRTSGGPESGHEIAPGLFVSNAQAWPSQWISPENWPSQKCNAPDSASSHRPAATQPAAHADRAPNTTQAARTMALPSSQNTSSAPRTALRCNGYCTAGGCRERGVMP